VQTAFYAQTVSSLGSTT